ncbi:Translin-associated factor X [Nesidiocoris tenuis]|uniref:Translin-associated factor X n=1 Tax=Nesidiocoris tenuis TaxID=355587 RepID=A0ABN7AUQ1_9HEMI|nr:Translin-associated factor X [Nesidiocoris tenuis]
MAAEASDNPVLGAFKMFSEELTAKHDKYERIVKISRDITIESKRLIFTLHNLPKGDAKTLDNSTLENIKGRLKKIEESHFKRIAIELENEDAYLYHRAYTWGVQEYVEALTYFEFINNNHLVEWENVTERCKFTIKPDSPDGESRTLTLLVPLTDYILGVMDMTGEVMRYCISALGAGDPTAARKACEFVKYVYCALHQISMGHKEYAQKFEVAGQSLGKMEYNCYLAKMQRLDDPSGPRLRCEVSPADGS